MSFAGTNYFCFNLCTIDVQCFLAKGSLPLIILHAMSSGSALPMLWPIVVCVETLSLNPKPKVAMASCFFTSITKLAM